MDSVRPVEFIPPGSRVLTVAAHPDDETIGAAGLMCELQLRGDAALGIATVTDGAPRNNADAVAAGFSGWAAYARARRAELAAALERLPRGAPEWFDLGFADQDVTHSLVDVVASVRRLIDVFGATIVITHPYEGGHPDHDATALAVHAATTGRGPAAAPPRHLEMTSYHWTGTAVATGEFLPADTPQWTLVLTDAIAVVKRQMLDCFTSQRSTLAMFPVAPHERFRVAPRYDFRSRPCPPGGVLYERFPWGVDSARWLACAGQALDTLHLDPDPGDRPIEPCL